MLLTKKSLIDSEFGIRFPSRGYSYVIVLKNPSNVFYCEDDCSADIQKQVGSDLKLIVQEQMQVLFQKR